MKKMTIIILISLAALLIAVFLTVTIAFSSKDHSEYDLPKHSATGKRTSESNEHKTIAQLIISDIGKPSKLSNKDLTRLMRKQMDERGLAFKIDAEIKPVNADGVEAEWVLAPNVNPNRRLLYIHGGAYVMGSPKSHRLITRRLSRIANAAVLVIDYRLMPEHSRMDGIDDCRKAYAWILENSPTGKSKVEKLMIAGDSSGGNLALSTIAWARDNKLRAADAVVTMSPQTDLTLTSPSLIKNIDTDIMQGKSFGPIVKAPKFFKLGFSFLFHKINPSNPIVSPLLGDLSNLPPTLIQVSEVEMFLDDAVRYVNKANDQGSNAILQTWPFVMHVWHAFQVPEADEAFNEIERFLNTYTMDTPAKAIE